LIVVVVIMPIDGMVLCVTGVSMKCIKLRSRFVAGMFSSALFLWCACGSGLPTDQPEVVDESAEVVNELQSKALSWKLVGKRQFTGSPVCPAGMTDKQQGTPCRQIDKRVQSCSVRNDTGFGYCRSGPPVFDQEQCLVPPGRPPVRDPFDCFRNYGLGCGFEPIPEAVVSSLVCR
jgi:hypothetical protein